ncbi:MAG: phospholipase D-like domain-containing protein [Candidatus Korobacteraceae bacterium]
MAELLRKLLEDPDVMVFAALVGFAVSSGVRELQPGLESLLKRGGSPRIVVGVSNRVTTVEGLQLLLELAKKGAEVFVFHNDTPSNPIFHPKLYLSLSENTGVLIVGSNNMTGKGLVSNYEISLRQELDLKNEADCDLVKSVMSIVDRYCDTTGGFAHVLDEAFLQELEAEGYLGSELLHTNKPETAGEGEGSAVVPATKKLFASKAVPLPAAKVTKPAAAAPPTPTAVSAPTPMPAVAKHGPILWQKKLAKSDVQRQKGHPTGVVRLTQARWKVAGKQINQLTYFRKDVFGGFQWKITKTQPFVEETEVKFDITIPGNHIGVRGMKLSDKPSGEAAEGNYTSSLHWGDLGDTVRKANLAGKTFTLYGPPTGSSEPFVIEIS